MKSYHKTRIRLLCMSMLLVIMCTMFAGCSGGDAQRELDSLAIVLGIALDKCDHLNEKSKENTEKSRLMVTAQVVRTSSVKGGNSGGTDSAGNSADAAYWNVELECNDIFAMLRSAVHRTNRKLYISHNKIIIFGEELAQEGINPYIDFFLRDHETRYLVKMVIAEGRAGDILYINSQLESLPAQDIEKLIEVQRMAAQAPTLTLFDYAIAERSAFTASLFPIIKSEEALSDNEGPDHFLVTGSAVIDDGKMIGKLDEKQTRGFLWVMNQVQSTVLVIPVDREETTASIEVLKATGKTDIKLDTEGSEPVLRTKVAVDISGSIGHLTENIPLRDEAVMKLIAAHTEQEVRDEILDAFQKARELGSDIFGISAYLSRHYPKQWNTGLRENWQELYKNMKIEVQVTANLVRTGSLIESMTQIQG